MDWLRGNLEQLVEECPNVVLEKSDILEIMSHVGAVNDIIAREQEDDVKIAKLSDEPEDSGNVEIDFADEDDPGEESEDQKYSFKWPF
ncbi:hypothetical protein [Nitrosopumilus sp.]|uniref:hypothetical protein n=1 Tax=Nitrosopumilus sp. TaxID=2024843 RepID=UPI003D10FD0D